MSEAQAEMNFADFARAIGVSPPYVARLKTEGRLVLSADGEHVRVAESVARIRDTSDPAKVRAAAPETPASRSTELPAEPRGDHAIGKTYQASRAIKEKYAAMTAKLDYDERCGDLLPREEVAAVAADIAATLRVYLEGMADRLAPQLAGVRDEARLRGLIAEHIEYALEELKIKFAAMAGGGQ